MKELFDKMKPVAGLASLSAKDLALLSDKFYGLASSLFPQELKNFYENVLSDSHQALQSQASKVLQKYRYNLYPELGVVQFLFPDNSTANEALIEVPVWVKEKYSNLKEEELLLACGFWLKKDNYRSLQISQGVWML